MVVNPIPMGIDTFTPGLGKRLSFPSFVKSYTQNLTGDWGVLGKDLSFPLN